MAPVNASAVLDTNTILDLWFFHDVRLGPLRLAIEEGRLALVSREDCIEELRLVLAYPSLAVPEALRHSLLAEYLARVRRVGPPAADAPPLPRCRDRDDQKFLEAARDGNVRWLVSRDKALLGLADHRLIAPRFRVLSPARFAADLSRPGYDSEQGPL